MKYIFWGISLSLLLFISCKKEETYTASEKIPSALIAFSSLTEVRPILADTESVATIYSRSFNVRNLLSVSVKDSGSIKITNYLPVAFKNVSLYVKIAGYSERIKLLTFDSIAPLVEFNYTPQLSQGQSFYYTETGKWVKLNQIKPLDNMVFSFDSPDTLFSKIKSLKPNWTINFNQRGTNFGSMKPYHAREYIVLFTNLAYFFSFNDITTALSNYQGLIDDAGNPISQATKEGFVPYLRDTVKVFNIGLVVGDIGGLTDRNSNIYGVHEWQLLKQYDESTSEYPHPDEITFHELGHVLGYSDYVTNMTYIRNNNGIAFFAACEPVWINYLQQKRMPIWDKTILNTKVKYGL